VDDAPANPRGTMPDSYQKQDDSNTGLQIALVRTLIFFPLLFIAVGVGMWLVFTGRNPQSLILLMVAAWFFSHLLIRLIFRRAKCRQCGQSSPLRWGQFYRGGTVYYHCEHCRILWLTDFQLARGGNGS
jgi:hypothetical protein